MKNLKQLYQFLSEGFDQAAEEYDSSQDFNDFASNLHITEKRLADLAKQLLTALRPLDVANNHFLFTLSNVDSGF